MLRLGFLVRVRVVVVVVVRVRVRDNIRGERVMHVERSLSRCSVNVYKTL